MSFKNRITAVALSCLLTVSLAACGGKEGSSSTSSGGNTSAPTAPVIDETMFSDSDKKTEPSAPTAVTLDGKTLTIGKAGEYVITNSIKSGQLVVDTDKNSEVHLVLNGVNITSDAAPAIYIKKAKKVIITLAEGSENLLSVKGTIADGEEDGAIYSKCDLTVNGKGSLKANTESGKGITSKDNLIITGGSFDITSKGHALDGNDSIRILDGSFKINTSGDGFHAENLENIDLGFIYMAGGSFNITAGLDGISALGSLKILSGSYKIFSGDGSQVYTAQNNRFSPSDYDAPSFKGIKSGSDLEISGGEFNIDSEDDALHANGKVTVSGGSGTISSGDDGIHADGALTLSGGKYEIKRSYEGLEGLSITISKGEYSITSSDDGLNAAGGNDDSGFGGGMRPDMFGASSDSFIKISGGELRVDASGDGIDSNGDIIVTGGETYVSGPTNSGNGAMDFGGNATISGGIFVAAGAYGMAQNFSSTSTQGAMLLETKNYTGGTIVKLTDSAGKTLFSHAFSKMFGSIVISTPDIKVGETYKLFADNEEIASVEMTSVIYGSGGGMGGPGGMGGHGGHGGPGGMPPGQRW